MSSICISQQDGWTQNHFLTPVSTLERDRFKSQPTLPTNSIQMSPLNHPGRPCYFWRTAQPRNAPPHALAALLPLVAASAMSSPAIRDHTLRDYQRAQSTMQFYNYQVDNSIHKKHYPGNGVL